jgi:hypothetical protein
MIIDFSNINGGGGGGYVLPVATSEVLGGVKVGSGLTITSAGTLSADAQPVGIATTATTGVVKIGSGITVDSAGTISVEGGGGSGIEVVSQLPASGTDGQVVILEEGENRTIAYSPSLENIDNDTKVISVTAVGLTERTLIWTWEWFGEYVPMYVNPDNSVTLTDSNGETILNIQVGDTDGYTFVDDHLGSQTVNISVNETGFVSESTMSIAKENPHPVINAEKKDTAYIWDSASKTCNIQQVFQTNFTPKTMITYFGSLPQNEIIFEQYHPYWGETWYWVFNGTTINAYDNIELTNFRGNVAVFNGVSVMDSMFSTFTDGLITINDKDNLAWTLKIHGNWADAGNGHWKPLDYEEKKKNALQVVDKYGFRRLYAPQVFDIRLASFENDFTYMPIPNGFGTSGQVLTASGDYDLAPVWVNKEEITNGVKFWKGTQAEYDAMSGTGYDNSTLYIITDTPNAI